MARWLLTFVVNRVLILAILATFLAVYPVNGCRSSSDLLGEVRQSVDWITTAMRELR
ncbi:hypothetical protein ACFQI3_08825 [Hansschlegelia quercus]|uniref:hypothetical protein n=1 Tax=Hansschlegelia quercus TaxID=2528245 RepID=UPI0013EF1BA0|nr:hypothetical protein [Hansschlegelia quercus]